MSTLRNTERRFTQRTPLTVSIEGIRSAKREREDRRTRDRPPILDLEYGHVSLVARSCCPAARRQSNGARSQRGVGRAHTIHLSLSLSLTPSLSQSPNRFRSFIPSVTHPYSYPLTPLTLWAPFHSIYLSLPLSFFFHMLSHSSLSSISIPTFLSFSNSPSPPFTSHPMYLSLYPSVYLKSRLSLSIPAFISRPFSVRLILSQSQFLSLSLLLSDIPFPYLSSSFYPTCAPYSCHIPFLSFSLSLMPLRTQIRRPLLEIFQPVDLLDVV